MKKNISFQRFFIAALIFSMMSVSLWAAPKDNRTFRISKNLSVFNTVFRELEAYYVDTLNYDKMMKTAIDEMLSKLDPYTVYMPEEETSDLTFMTTGEYAGIGAMIMKTGNDIVVSEPYEGMPAQRNDVRAGDIILEVDGKSTSGMSVSDVSNRLKGTPNTTIKLKLKRFGEKKTVEKAFLREKIQINPIAYSAVVAPQTGYILLSDFTDKSALELKSTVNEMIKSSNINALVIDLRNNGGGLIDEAVKILGYFLPKGTEVVNTKGKNKMTERMYKTPTEPVFPDMKLTVLVNRASASASEILAGAVQDLDRGLVIGERTFGKGLVQNIRPVGYGGHLKITTAKYYIPSGRCIQAIDYSHRNEDGSVGRVPDSLTTEFKTRNGRTVRDGGGIVPDITITDDRKLNIAYYIFAQNLYFDFANEFVSKTPAIAKASDFVLSEEDFKAFTDFLVQKNFTYTSQTQKYYNELFEMAKMEGLDEVAKAEFDSLKEKLLPDVRKNITDNKAEIAELLSLEIIKRYYFQKGEVEFSLRTDKALKTALEKMNDTVVMSQILKTK
ncbi:MAG: S41 family peptidase [Paludibacter sp.]|jgi:carboxyl-terminal processing protease|nr:S41 family peptidase [Paludibacter sp.]